MMRTHFIDDTKTKQVRLIVRGKVLSRTIFKSTMRWSDFYSLLGVGIGFIITFVIDIRSIRSNQWTKRHRQYFFLQLTRWNTAWLMKLTIGNRLLGTDFWSRFVFGVFRFIVEKMSIYFWSKWIWCWNFKWNGLESACAVRIVSRSRELHNNSKHCSSVQK